MFNKILTAFDFSEPSKCALAWSARLAKHDAARLELLHVVPPHVYSGDAQLARKEVMQHAATAMTQEMQHTFGGDTLPPKHHVVIAHGNPQQRILQHLQECTPDLVVIGSHGRSGLGRLLMGSVAEHVVRHANAPVLVVRKTPPQQLTNIMVPVDFSGETEQTMKFLEDFAEHNPAQFTLVHVVQNLIPLPYAGDPGFAPSTPSLEEREKTAATRLQKLVERYPQLKLQVKLLTGSIIDNLSDYCAAQRFDLVITPTHGNSGFERLLLGSTAEQVIRYVDCNVLCFVYGKYLDTRKTQLNDIASLAQHEATEVLRTEGIGIH